MKIPVTLLNTFHDRDAIGETLMPVIPINSNTCQCISSKIIYHQNTFIDFPLVYFTDLTLGVPIERKVVMDYDY